MHLHEMKNFEARAYRESEMFYHLVKVGPVSAGAGRGWQLAGCTHRNPTLPKLPPLSILQMGPVEASDDLCKGVG